MKLIQQDWVAAAGLLFKSAAIFLTFWLIHSVPCIAYEQNPVTRSVLGNSFHFALLQFGAMGIMLAVYMRVRRKYLGGMDGRKAFIAFNLIALTFVIVNAVDAFNNVNIMVDIMRTVGTANLNSLTMVCALSG